VSPLRASFQKLGDERLPRLLPVIRLGSAEIGGGPAEPRERVIFHCAQACPERIEIQWSICGELVHS